ncbi:MAG: hypothetical protein LC687_03515, partial [Actinobacteria bacterium]|nr:hypothetical protein [Actinomycetota bacterium]
SVNMAFLTQEDNPVSDNEALLAYAINEVKRRNRDSNQLAAQMNKQTWTSLDDANKKVWDEMTKEGKAKILDYATDRGVRRSAHVHDTSEPSSTLQVNTHDVQEASTAPDSHSDASPNPTISVHNTMQQVRREAHPGDPRRVLGSDKGTKPKLTAMMHRLTTCSNNDSDASDSDDDPISSYWNNQDFR